MNARDPRDKATIIGFFSEAWDAERALEDLAYAGFEQRLRYIQNDYHPHDDSSKKKPDLNGFFAKIYGFDTEDEYLDSRGNWTVSPEAEAYFTAAYERKHHIILIQAREDGDRAIEILHHHHAQVEEQNFAFFNAVAQGQDRALEAQARGIPPKYHQTKAIEPPLESKGY